MVVDWSYAVPALILVAALVFVLLRAASPTEGLDRRLNRIKGGAGYMSLGRPTSARRVVVREGAAWLSKLTAPFLPKNEKERRELELRLLQAGFRGPNALMGYLAIQWGGVLMAPVLVIIAFAGAGGGPVGTLLLIGLAMAFPLAPWLYIRRASAARQDAILRGFPDALDLLVICVESGLAIDGAMSRVAVEIQNSHKALGQEMELAMQQMQMGLERDEVLLGLAERAGIDDMHFLARVLVQAAKYGTGIGKALRDLSDSTRSRRRQKAEEAAAKLPTKLILPMALFIFPVVFVVVLGPMVLTMGSAFRG